jgi:hypothetical protein
MKNQNPDPQARSIAAFQRDLKIDVICIALAHSLFSSLDSYPWLCLFSLPLHARLLHGFSRYRSFLKRNSILILSALRIQ